MQLFMANMEGYSLGGKGSREAPLARRWRQELAPMPYIALVSTTSVYHIKNDTGSTFFHQEEMLSI